MLLALYRKLWKFSSADFVFQRWVVALLVIVPHEFFNRSAQGRCSNSVARA